MKNKNKKKIVYLALAADTIHNGHINIINIAKKYGDVYVGLLTDQAINEYKIIPKFSFEQRFNIVSNLKFVKKVIPQNSLSYKNNLLKLRPEFVVHGDDWKVGVQKKIRKEVIDILKIWKGKLIEPKTTKIISEKKILEENISSSEITSRISLLRRLLNSKDIVRVIEAHNPLSAFIVEKAFFKKKNKIERFDCLWSSSLTDSVVRAKPDNQSVEFSTRINGISEIFEISNKPIIFDADNGGSLTHLKILIKKLENLGVSAICIEDKIGEKINSLFKNQKKSKQDSVKAFSQKIKKIKDLRKNRDFLIIARIESLILGKSVSDAFKRAVSYSKAGADLILIHSKDKNTSKLFEFSKKFYNSSHYKPLVVVPSSFSHVTENVLIKNHFKIVIYANHLMRATFPSLERTAVNILKFGRAKETEKYLAPIKTIISLIK